jgi:hypothetical protein
MVCVKCMCNLFCFPGSVDVSMDDHEMSNTNTLLYWLLYNIFI